MADLIFKTEGKSQTIWRRLLRSYLVWLGK